METTIKISANYNEVKDHIKIRLVNKSKAKKVGMYRSAKKYGFEDLIIVPILEIGEVQGGLATTQITKELVDRWGVTKAKVFADGIRNLDYRCTSMFAMMTGIMEEAGIEDDELIVPDEPMFVVTNRNLCCGASSIIAAAKELRTKFPDGYIVLPSSIHEVIVVPINDYTNELDLLDMVKQINAGVVSEEDFLADNVYRFEA